MQKLKIDKGKFLTYMHNSFGVCLVITVTSSNVHDTSTPILYLKLKDIKIILRRRNQGHSGQSWSHLSAWGALSFYLVLYLNKTPSMLV